ncbi:hypothetical protein niasHT_001955 [Heterodera trifolii]|uniref:Uncharacterized protein n=1 Tax=Heterodera trifolii TaxID=157864 RepID=A0ABD2M3D4_9BILA
MSAVVKFDNALALPTRQLKRPLSPPQIAQDLFGSVDGRQLVTFLSNTEEDENAVLVNAISFLRRLVAQFGGHRLEPDDLLEGTLPTADNRAMALDCLQMDDGTHSQQTKHSRAKEVIDRLGLAETGRHGFAEFRFVACCACVDVSSRSNCVCHQSAIEHVLRRESRFFADHRYRLIFEDECRCSVEQCLGSTDATNETTMSPPQIAQDLFGSVDGRQLVTFLSNTEEDENAVLVNAISFLRRLVAQFSGHHLEPDDLLLGTLPTADNRAMALECLQMDDGTHSQSDQEFFGSVDGRQLVEFLSNTEEGENAVMPVSVNAITNRRSTVVLDRLVGTGRHSSLVVHALMSAVGPIALVTNPQLNLCFEGDLFGSVDGRQLVEFVLNTEEDENAVLVNAISFFCRLVAQFSGHHLEANDLLEGTLPTADNRAMALECLQMDDGTHSQQTKHSRAKEVKDGLGDGM